MSVTASVMDSNWLQSLDQGCAVLVEASLGAQRVALVRGRSFSGGGSWVQLLVDDAAAPGGSRRRSVPPAALRRLDAAAWLQWAHRLRGLAELEGIALREEAAAEAEVQLEIRTLGGGAATARAPERATVEDLHRIVAASLSASGIHSTPDGTDLVLGTERLVDPTAMPLLGAGEEVTLTVVRRPPIQKVALPLTDAASWSNVISSAGRCSVEVTGTLLADHLQRLCEVIPEHTDMIIGLELGPWQAPISETRRLAAMLPATLEEAALTASWHDAEHVATLLAAMPPNLRKLEVSGGVELAPAVLDAVLRLQDLQHLGAHLHWRSEDTDARNALRAAMRPGCELVF